MVLTSCQNIICNSFRFIDLGVETIKKLLGYCFPPSLTIYHDFLNLSCCVLWLSSEKWEWIGTNRFNSSITRSFIVCLHIDIRVDKYKYFIARWRWFTFWLLAVTDFQICRNVGISSKPLHFKLRFLQLSLKINKWLWICLNVSDVSQTWRSFASPKNASKLN